MIHIMSIGFVAHPGKQVFLMRHPVKIILSFWMFFCFMSLSSSGQNISGTVLDAATDQPLENVTVYFRKAQFGTVTDARGQFLLRSPVKILLKDSLRFSIVGYTPRTYTLSMLKTHMFVVRLSKKTENLSEVVIAGKKILKPSLDYKKLALIKKSVYHFGSVLIGDKIYVSGGDESSLDDAAKRALDENRSGSFREFLRDAGKSFVWEGYNGQLQIYDILQNTWKIPDVKLEKRAYHKLIFLHHKLYIIGGKTLSANKRFEYLADNIEVFDPLTHKIIVDDINPHQAVDFTAVAFHGNIIVMGGSVKQKSTGEKVYTDQSRIYNTATGYWYALPKMTHAKEVNGIIVGQKVYLIGGSNKEALKEIETYDLSTGKWHYEGDLFYAASYPALACYNQTIYIFNEDKMQTYNVQTGLMKTYNIDLKIKGSQMHYYKDSLYIVGGYAEDEYKKTPVANVYCIPLSEFSKTRIIDSKVIR